MSNFPLVSVVMPVYNSEKYLQVAIDSILNQTYGDFEFLIIDDASTDNSLQIIESYSDSRIKVIKNSATLRVTRAINAGAKQARGKYILRMDSDDWSFPDRIEKQLEFMEENPEVVECGGSIYVCDSDLKVVNLRTYPQTDEDIRKKIFKYNPFAHPATIWRTAAMIQVGFYDETIPLTQDYDLTFRIGNIGKLANLATPVIKLRTHAQSQSVAKSFEQQSITLVIRAKAVTKYGYHMSFGDKIYFAAQWTAMRLLPSKVKFKLFNFIRRFL